MRRPAVLLSLFLPLMAIVWASSAKAQSGPPGGQSALNTEMRMSALEDRIRELNGRIEELTNNLGQMKQQLDRLSSDVDVRFGQLQPAPQPPGGPGTITPPPPQPKPPAGAGDMTQPPSRSGTIGTLGAAGGSAPSAPPPQGAPAGPPPGQQTASVDGTLPVGSSQEQYNYAMGLLTQANYPAAEQAMRSFVQRWPNDPLAANAQYWLGETFYVRKDYGNAATAFAQGYEKYPKGPKAVDDLLKLGMSLAALNQKPDACRAYARVQRDFPNAPQSVKDRLTAERQRTGC